MECDEDEQFALTGPFERPGIENNGLVADGLEAMRHFKTTDFLFFREDLLQQ